MDEDEWLSSNGRDRPPFRAIILVRVRGIVGRLIDDHAATYLQAENKTFTARARMQERQRERDSPHAQAHLPTLFGPRAADFCGHRSFYSGMIIVSLSIYAASGALSLFLSLSLSQLRFKRDPRCET